ncbi:MAG: serine hydrolase domain-containing protein [Chitinophagaceae bacterium]|nr:serine hydrolase domain-containing protein [Chitinophagaceae bacterium]
MAQLYKQLLVITTILFTQCSSPKEEKNNNNILENLNRSQKKEADYLLFTEDSLKKEKTQKYTSIIDSIFSKYSRLKHIPGISYAIVVDTEIIHKQSYGYANVEKKIKTNSQTRFRIASMTKSFTAMGIISLQEKKKLRIHDPAWWYSPTLQNISYPTDDSPEITLFHLLTMTAGFPEDNPWGDRQLADTDEELLHLNLSFSHEPGTSYEYSNVGYALLGQIIKNVSAQTYSEYITKTILNPLGMKESVWDYRTIDENILAMGYRWENNTWKKEPLLPDGSYNSMGGLICSTDDFCKYISFLLSANPPRNAPDTLPISRSGLREMQRIWIVRDKVKKNTTVGYGFGFRCTYDEKGILKIGHGGGLPGFGSSFLFLPEYGIGIVALSNLTYADMGTPVTKAIDTILSLTNISPRTLIPNKTLLQTQQYIIKNIPDMQDTTLFADNFFKDESWESRKKNIQNIRNIAGKIQSIHTLIPENALRGSFTLSCEKKDIEIYFTLSPEKPTKIQYLKLTTKEKQK